MPTPVKRAVTTVQLLQFGSCLITAGLTLVLDSTPLVYSLAQFLYHVGMLYLFLPLLLGRGARKPSAEPPPLRSSPRLRAKKAE